MGASLVTTWPLRAEQLTKHLGGRAVVDRVSLELAAGEVVGLLGPNGAGKTTIFGMLMGLVRPDAGRVWLGSRELTGLPAYRRAQLGLGYLPQEPSAFAGLSVADNLRAVLELGDGRAGRVDELLARFGLSERRAQRAASLSGGERRRLELARLLVTDPAVVLLDEPFRGLDPESVHILVDVIRELSQRGRAVLMTDHAVSRAFRICQRTYVLVEGQVIAAGPPDVVCDHPEARQRLLMDEQSDFSWRRAWHSS